MAWAAWASKTSICTLFPGLKIDKHDSQFFWNQMDRVSLEALEAIENALTKKVISELGINLDTLFYDTTNFFTYIASTNHRSKLAQRGHSKQKRADLRLFSLSLLMSREGQIPLCSHVYEGNVVDVTAFPDSLSRIRTRLEALSVELKELTFVYDRGNNSRANQALVDEHRIGYVGALTPSHHVELLEIPSSKYQALPESSAYAGVPVLRLKQPLWGAERTLLLFISEQLRAGQIRGLEQHLQNKLRVLAQWKETLKKPGSGPRSSKSAQKQVDEILSGQYVKRVLRVKYDAKLKGANRLDYWLDEDARAHLQTEIFGKRILMTNRHEWSDDEIMGAYRGQHHVEGAFRQLKDDRHMAIRPQYHWTDQKIHVHAFICMLAFLLGRTVEYEARRISNKKSLSGILDLLGTVRLALLLRPSGKKGGRPRCEYQLEDGDEQALRLFRRLVPQEKPLVYTPQSR
jgi:transposase